MATIIATMFVEREESLAALFAGILAIYAMFDDFRRYERKKERFTASTMKLLSRDVRNYDNRGTIEVTGLHYVHISIAIRLNLTRVWPRYQAFSYRLNMKQSRAKTERSLKDLYGVIHHHPLGVGSYKYGQNFSCCCLVGIATLWHSLDYEGNEGFCPVQPYERITFPTIMCLSKYRRYLTFIFGGKYSFHSLGDEAERTKKKESGEQYRSLDDQITRDIIPDRFVPHAVSITRESKGHEIFRPAKHIFIDEERREKKRAMRGNGRGTNTKKKKEKARGNKVKERRERDEETVAGYKRTAVASNPFAAEAQLIAVPACVTSVVAKHAGYANVMRLIELPTHLQNKGGDVKAHMLGVLFLLFPHPGTRKKRRGYGWRLVLYPKEKTQRGLLIAAQSVRKYTVVLFLKRILVPVCEAKTGHFAVLRIVKASITYEYMNIQRNDYYYMPSSDPKDNTDESRSSIDNCRITR
ncbi:hypothetical protein EAG_09510 [Camponotus floridanus]|uniref:Uncharacterized protein n=1 Tax=Camponotus floridanus TaxID=104421 RepID=E1ZZ78_CAMFO|nr:hypothetical protein EAG_09510 [Camponotus floridanus]